MRLEFTHCPICDADDCMPVAVGTDFEYQTSNEEFLAVQCRTCDLIYLNPRPDDDSLSAAYPDHYHAFSFDKKAFGLIYRVRQRLEAMRVLRWCKGLQEDARILDVGCGDGFHIELLKKFGMPSWKVEGIDADPRVLEGATQRGIEDCIRVGQLRELGLDHSSYDLILMVMTIEHLADPLSILAEIHRILKIGGRLAIVTDNTGSPDFAFFKNRHWGGYHFPRHLHLFNRDNLRRICSKAELRSISVKTALSPVNWTYSLRNWIQDWRGPIWLRDRLSLKSPLALSFFTLIDFPLSLVGRGAILHGLFEKSKEAP